MGTKFVLLALFCALVFTTSNSMRPGMKKSGPPLVPKKIWHHFPYFGGGFGKGVGLGHHPGGARFNGGGRDVGNNNEDGEGFVGGNGGGEGFGNGGDDIGSDGKGEAIDHGEEVGSSKSAGGVP